MKTLTIFTPTYNRINTLKRTYQSLLNQTSNDFEWLIIDDGSTDNTREIVSDWLLNDKISIRYIYKENGGMHTAHNLAYKNINTELNMCIDSDDACPPDAVESIIHFWKLHKDEPGIAGIIALDNDMNTGKVIGTPFRENMTRTKLEDYYLSGGSGDKKLIYVTDIIKSIDEYPVFEGEKYVGLAYKYHIIDKQYDLLTLNKVVCNVEYQQDGSSKNMLKQYIRNPNGFAFYRKYHINNPKKASRYIKDVIHYDSSCFFARKNPFHGIKTRDKVVAFLMYPIGLILSLYIFIKTK